MTGTGRGSRGGSLLVPLGAAVAGGSFFLPYVRVLRVLGLSVSLSGPRVGGGLWLLPAIALMLLIAYFVWPGATRPRLRLVFEAVLAALGLLLVAAVIARLHHRTGFLFVRFSAATFGVRPAIGWVLSLAGFAMAGIGAVLRRHRSA